MSEGVAPVEGTPKTDRQSREEADELMKLHEQVMSLEIDKRVRDGLLDQLKNERKELLGQLQGHVEILTKQSREIGQLETRLELSAPAPHPKSDDDNLPLTIVSVQPELHWEGDNETNHHSQFGV